MLYFILLDKLVALFWLLIPVQIVWLFYDPQISLALLLGSDYSQGIHGFGPVSNMLHFLFKIFKYDELINTFSFHPACAFCKDMFSQQSKFWMQESACRIVKSLGDDSVLHRIISVALNMERKCKRGKKITKNVSCNVNKENEHGNNISLDSELEKGILLNHIIMKLYFFHYQSE